MRRLVPAVMALGLGLGAACGGGGGDDGGEAAADTATDAMAVEGKEYGFEPATLTAQAGEVTFELKNTGSLQHDLAVDDPRFKVTALAGQTKSGKVELEAGTYEFYCSVTGHRGQGMEGTLTVG